MDTITVFLEYIEFLGWDNVLLGLAFVAYFVLKNSNVMSRLWKLNTERMQTLFRDLHNGTRWQRRTAAFRLGKSGRPEAVPALIQAFRTADASVRRSVVNGLEDIGTEDANAFLATLSESDHALMKKDLVLLIRVRDTLLHAGVAGAVVFFLGLLLDVSAFLTGMDFPPLVVAVWDFFFYDVLWLFLWCIPIGILFTSATARSCGLPKSPFIRWIFAKRKEN